MDMTMNRMRWLAVAGLAVLASTLGMGQANAAVPGIPGPNFALTAKQINITTPDGDSVRVWAYGEIGGIVQYPGPTLIVNQGDSVSISLINELNTTTPMPISILFPGQTGVTATGGSTGRLTQESTGPGDTVTYSFTASNPGTYLYNSGTRPELQIEMGLLGALIVRPAVAGQAYSHASTAYDHEYLYVLTEMDPQIHYLAEIGQFDAIDNSTYNPVLWFINGRNGPDTIADAGVSWLPNQPYNALSQTEPGQTVLARVINAGRDLHPFHPHGNHVSVIAQDGRLLESGPALGPDLARVTFTIQTVPGATYDALWNWTGAGLGWDVYGHGNVVGDPACDPGAALEPFEDVDSHCVPFPVTLPSLQEMTFGGFYSGSPFLGSAGDLPPGEGGLNLNNGMFFMWHSHTEKELVNNDIAPGGMMTMMIVEPPGTLTP